MRKISGKRTIYTYTYLYSSAKFSYEDGIRKENNHEEGYFFNYLNSILLFAFALEAYLNHCGESIVDFWDNIEKIGTLDKLEVISLMMGIHFEKSRRPYQTVKELFRVRNQLVHARTENLESVFELEDEENLRNKKPVAKWEELCSHESVERIMQDIEEIIVLLHKKAFDNGSPFLIMESGFWG